MRIHPARLLLLPCLVLSTGCFGDLVEVPDPVPDAGTDAGAVGSVTGELTVAPLFGPSAVGGASVVATAADDRLASADLSGPAAPVAAHAAAAPSARPAPSKADVQRLLRQFSDDVPAALARPGTTRAQRQIIPGEFIIVTKAAQAARAQPGLRAQRAQELRLGMDRLSLAAPEHRIVELAGPTSRMQAVRVTHRDGRALTVPETLAMVDRLAQHPDIAIVEPNERVFAQATPNDTFFPYQWHYAAMKLPKAWDILNKANNVVVAVLDTGILPHPDLAPNVVDGIDLIADPVTANDGDGRDMDPMDPGGDAANGDSSWHGTHVAGTIGARGNNGTGVTGVAWETRIQPVRVLGKGGGSHVDVLAGIEWASGGTVDGVPENGTPADVINLSLGGSASFSQVVQDVIDDAVARGAIIVVAAGNENEPTSGKFPCLYERVICVGATRLDGSRAGYSNYGPEVDVMAPGGDLSQDANNDRYSDGVLSTKRGTNSSGQTSYVYTFDNGTSMASPHVAGLVALMKSWRKSAGQTLDVNEALTILRSTASAGSKCSEGCGAGLVDAQKALLLTSGQEVPVGPGELSIISTSLQLVDSEVGTLQLSNVGGQSLTVSASFFSADGATVDFPAGASVSLAPGQTQGLQVRAASTLDDGRYQGSLTLVPSVGETRTVGVTIQVGPAPGDGLPVLLVFAYLDDAGEWQAGAGGRVPMGEDGRYRYLAKEVPVGEYVVMGAIDDDQDGEFGEENERFGAYPTVSTPTTVVVLENQTNSNIDFAIVPPSDVGLPDDTGGAAIGGACSTNADCGSGNTCNTSITGGYCTRACDSAACPSGSTCYVMQQGTPNEFRTCMQSCTPPDGGRGNCRSDLLCHADGSGNGYCLSNCTNESSTFCGGGSTCQASGYCD